MINEVVGCVRVRKVQWYQTEILHLSVAPHYRGRGVAWDLMVEAEWRARAIGARLLQCTIRIDNLASCAFFTDCNFSCVSTFCNAQGNKVAVYQKILI